MARRLSSCALLLCLACWTVSAQAGSPPVVRTGAQLKAVVASGQPTPLDALTPFGKRAVLRSLHWSEDGQLVGIDFAVVERELDARQLAALLAFVGGEDLLPMLSRHLDGQPVRLPDPSADVEKRLESFRTLAREDTERRRTTSGGATPTGAAELQAHYTRLFGDRLNPSALQRQPLGDLPLLFEAADTMNRYHSGTVLRDQLNIHRVLASRGVTTQRWFDRQLFDALVTSRRFDEARVFASTRPALAGVSIPSVTDPLGPGFKGRSLYRYDSATNSLTREAAPAPAGIQVVMVVQEGCQPSARALAALREDAELQARLRKVNLLLVTIPSGSIPLHFIARWNAANPTLPMRASYSVEEWKDVNPPGVPEFFVLKDGKPVSRLREGWPPEGNKAALMALLDAARD